MSWKPPQIGQAPTGISRRRFLLGLGAAAGAAVLAPRLGLASTRAGPDGPLTFVHTHTGELLSLDWRGSALVLPGEMARVETFLRDFRTGDRHAIDPALLDQLQALRLATRSRAPFQVVSGYRSPATNDALRTGRGGQARHSLHMEGRAIDVRLADVPSDVLRDAAIDLGRGGVGYYRESDFVHVDTGRRRTW